MVWDLAQWGAERDGTRVKNSPTLINNPHLIHHSKPGPADGKHQARTVQDLETCPGQVREGRFTAVRILILVLRTSEGF